MPGDPPKKPDAEDDTGFLGRRANAFVKRLIAAHPRFAAWGWLLVMLLWVATLPFAWLCWWLGLPEVWQWAGDSVLKGIAAVIASLFIALGPVYAWMIVAELTGILAEASVRDEKQTIEKARETEEEALKRLEETDAAGLLPLLRYSRAQLLQYYTMGLGQTQRAFINAALAMWLGFLLLIFGIGLYIGLGAKLGIKPPPENFNQLIIASAVIIEVISALFLWVYRSTIGQLTFYYRLQMQSHTAILCFRIANTMDKADEAKGAVIDKLLSASLTPERPAPMGAKTIKGLLQTEE